MVPTKERVLVGGQWTEVEGMGFKSLTGEVEEFLAGGLGLTGEPAPVEENNNGNGNGEGGEATYLNEEHLQ